MIKVRATPNIQSPPPPPYYDNYSGPADSFLTLDSPNDWAGQSFTTSQPYYAKRIELWIKKGPGSNIGDIEVEIYGVDGNGHPQTPILNSGVIANADVTEDYSWVSCNLDFYLLSTATKYCIVVHGDSLDVDNTLIWAGGGDGSGLPNGDQKWSINNGGSWTTDTTRDQLFRCYPLFLQEYYNDEQQGLESHGAYVNFELGQTFTPQSEFVIAGVRLYVRRQATVGDVFVGIYETSLGHPFGPTKCSAVVDGSGWDNISFDWIYWEFSTPFALSADSLYAIWLSGAGYDAANCPVWKYDNTAAGYVRGTFEMNQGAGWVTKPDWDFLFEVWSA